MIRFEPKAAAVRRLEKAPDAVYTPGRVEWIEEIAQMPVKAFDVLIDPPKRPRGRPVAPKPWEAEGVSRMTWYRRKKKDETK